VVSPDFFPPLFRRDDKTHEAIARAAGNLAGLPWARQPEDSPHEYWDYGIMIMGIVGLVGFNPMMYGIIWDYVWDLTDK
jgi:hypothetical protein